MNTFKIQLFVTLAFTTILSAILLTACSAPALSVDFNENEVKLLSQDVVSLLNAQDSKGLRAIFTEQMNTAITDDVFVQIYAAIEGGGKFEVIDNITVGGSTDKSTGEEFATAVVTAKYENQTFTYTITFNKQMQLAGLYYR
jgi:predicted methyltransferase